MIAAFERLSPVAQALIPEALGNGNTHQATLGVMIGFAVMMTLDVALG